MTATIQKQTDTWLKRIYQALSHALVNSSNLADYFEPLLQPISPLWSARDYRARITRIRQETHNCFTLVMEPNKKWRGFEPGQFIALKVRKNGAEISRCFSISSSQQQYEQANQIELTIRIQDQGRMTPWIHEHIQPTNIVGLSAAMGDFVIQDKGRPILMIAGGSGITPFRSYLNTQKNACWPRQSASLMYYASTPSEHLFAQELTVLNNEKSLKTSLISSQDKGRFSLEHLKQHCPHYLQHDIYICGPNEMIEHVKDTLLRAHVDTGNIYIEHFGPTTSDVNGISEGGVVHFQQSKKHVDISHAETLLQIAENNRINAPSGCKMGVCHQCKCRKYSGTTYNTLTKTYSDSGEEDIQLCVSIPVGEVTLEL